MAIVAAVIVVVTLAVMTTGRVPAVLALICALVVAGLLGIAAPAELFGGLSNGGVITIAAMLVIAKGVLARHQSLGPNRATDTSEIDLGHNIRLPGRDAIARYG